MNARPFLAALALVTTPVPAASPRVTGFEYSWAKDLERTPALVAWLKKDRAAQYRDYAQLFVEEPEFGPPLSAYENTTNWTVQTRLAQLIILTAGRASYTGGAHGYGFTDTLIWDAKTSKPVPFAGLFANPGAAEALLTPLYCKALDVERRERRGESTPPDDIFGLCPKLFETGKIWPDKPVYNKFSRIAMSFGPYAVGPYAEGTYDLEIVIPKGLKALVKPEYRVLFPG